jgi:hypothetical protein
MVNGWSDWSLQRLFEVQDIIETSDGRDELGSEDWLVQFDTKEAANEVIAKINAVGDNWKAVSHEYVTGMIFITRKVN